MVEGIVPIPSTFIPILVLYFVVVIGLGYLAYVKTDSIRNFMTAGGTMGALVGGFAYLATQFSMSTFMGAPGVAGIIGYGFVALAATIVFAIWVPAFLVGIRLRYLSGKLSLYTLPDYFGSRYYGQLPRAICAIVTFAYIMPIMAAQLLGAGVIWEIFTGNPPVQGTFLMAIFVILYCMAGGLRGSMLTSVLQAALMIITAVVTFGVVGFYGGGFSNLNASIDPALLSFPGKVPVATYRWLFSQMLLFTVFTIGMPQLTIKFFAMKDRRTITRSGIIGGAGLFTAAMFMLGIGAMASGILTQLPANVDYTVPMIVSGLLPPVLASLLMSGLIAAGMSTIDAQLVMLSGVISRDFYHKMINPRASEVKVLGIARIATVCVGILGLALAYTQPAGIWDLIIVGLSGVGIMAAPIILGVRWKRTTQAGAVIGLIVGQIYLITATLWVTDLRFGFVAGVPALAVTFIVTIIVSLLTAPPPLKVLEEHYT